MPFVTQRAYDDSHTEECIRKAFKMAGLVPFHPQLVIDRYAHELNYVFQFLTTDPYETCRGIAWEYYTQIETEM